ncbi:hypothetical protein I2485_11155 [Nesterenkonia sp. E16_7]|uniref:hypothetical protein n=1 Tax=unclassified Nesterenkonia TaxID=2629769 RepID=UPI001A911EE8|nr:MULTISPECIES: hypothetical protein [unclassified Nesterenkonia]MBO0595353.1 hypothetical protein [Nesterenkonia sp. E16_10]MBO0599199.1 hypothetical protein [Nesterenkonia sp. E16_7]
MWDDESMLAFGTVRVPLTGATRPQERLGFTLTLTQAAMRRAPDSPHQTADRVPQSHHPVGSPQRRHNEVAAP